MSYLGKFRYESLGEDYLLFHMRLSEIRNIINQKLIVFDQVKFIKSFGVNYPDIRRAMREYKLKNIIG